jgi:serpin B
VLLAGGSSGQGPLAGSELYTRGPGLAGPALGALGEPATRGVTLTAALAPTPGPAMTPTAGVTSSLAFTATLAPTPGPEMTPTAGVTSSLAFTAALAPTSSPAITPTVAVTSGASVTTTLAPTPGPVMTPTVGITPSLAVTPTVVVAASEAPGGRDTDPQASPADQAALVAGNNAFAFALYDALRGGPGNLVFSPYGISSALAMAYAGARGQTETQMSGTLDFTLPQARLHPAFDALDLALASRTQISSSFQLTVTNSLWGQTGHPFLESFLDVLKQDYGAGLQPVDFQAAPEQARQAINAWIADNTRGKITDLIPDGAVSAATRLVLADALYFKGAWADPFERDETANGAYHLLDGSQVSVPMMEQKAFFNYAEGPGYRAVELPYSGGDVSMVVLLPPAGQLDTFEKSLSADRLADMLQGFASTQVDLTLPKFKYGSTFALGKTLGALGMPDAFDPSAADFSGMDGQAHDLFIGEVEHEALVAVDEEGTEAAAATAVLMPGAIAPAPVEKIFKADHPFVYLIRDVNTGTILFLGRVEDPSQG